MIKKVIGVLFAAALFTVGLFGVANAATAHNQLKQVDLQTACHITLREWNNSTYQIQGRSAVKFASHTNFYVPINKTYVVRDLHNGAKKSALC